MEDKAKVLGNVSNDLAFCAFLFFMWKLAKRVI